MRSGNTAKGVVVHHSASTNRPALQPSSVEQARAAGVVRAFFEQHTAQNGWLDIGYNYVITRGGDIWEARRGSLWAASKGQVIRGAHSGRIEYNKFWWGICLEGTFTDTLPEPIQLRSLVDLVTWLFLVAEVDSSKVIGHRDAKDTTACPGDKLEALLPGIRAQIHSKKLDADPSLAVK